MSSNINIVCITLGGQREAKIISSLKHPSITLHIVPGVYSRKLSSKRGLLSECYKAGILRDDPDETYLARCEGGEAEKKKGRVSDQKGVWVDCDYPEELWRKVRE